MKMAQAIGKKVIKRDSRGVKMSLGYRITDVIIYTLMALVGVFTLLPFLYVVAGSFATDKELTERAFFIIPRVWSLNAYKYAINEGNILRGLWNSIKLTVLGTCVNMALSASFAYPLSKKHFRGRNFILNMVIVTMLFSGGLIPTFLVIGFFDHFAELIKSFPNADFGASKFQVVTFRFQCEGIGIVCFQQAHHVGVRRLDLHHIAVIPFDHIQAFAVHFDVALSIMIMLFK